METNNIDKVLSTAEKIGVIGSPSSTSQLTLDILGSAVEKKLVGELSLFSFTQDGCPNYALGQITEIELQNVWHQDPTMRSLIRERGHVDPVSGRQDTHMGQMAVSAVFKKNGSSKSFQPSILGTIPATGTSINVVTDAMLNTLLESQKDELFYLGHVYGSTPKLPCWFKHFGEGERGAGEAYHIGVFGKTGSGKSVLSKMIMTGYARHKEMGIFVIDPQGEFSKDVGGSYTGTFRLPLSEAYQKLGRKLVVFKVKNLLLDTWELFEETLYGSDFFEKLTIPKGENRRLAAQELTEKLRKKRITLDRLFEHSTFDEAWKILLEDEQFQKIVYKSEPSRNRFIEQLKSMTPDDKNDMYKDYWMPVSNLFNGNRKDARSITTVIRAAVEPGEARPIIIVNLKGDKTGVVKDEDKIIWNERIKHMVIKRFLDMIQIYAEKSFDDNKLLNALVIIDEASRIAPAGESDSDQLNGLKRSLVDAARTTRKYGLGWMFISQTLASLDKEIWGQMGVYYFGFGLSAGTEYRTLQEIVGGDTAALKLYRTFRHPQSAFDSSSKEYPFMTYGPVSPLSFTGTPLFLSAFTSPTEFLKENNINLDILDILSSQQQKVDDITPTDNKVE